MMIQEASGLKKLGYFTCTYIIGESAFCLLSNINESPWNNTTAQPMQENFCVGSTKPSQTRPRARNAQRMEKIVLSCDVKQNLITIIKQSILCTKYDTNFAVCA